MAAQPTSKTINFYDKNAQMIMKRLYNFYTTGRLCDAELVIGNRSYLSHKLILRANSEYFKEHLTKTQDKVVIETEETFNKNAIDSAIGYYYHGAMTLKQFCEMVDIIKFAKLVKSERLESYCFFALENGVGKGNFRYAIEVGEYFEKHELLDRVQDYLMNHFLEAIRTEDFKYLSEERLLSVVQSNELRLLHEKQAFEGLQLWLNHDWDNRKACLESLLVKLRMPLVPVNYLLEEVRPMCESSLTLCNMLIDSITWHLIESSRKTLPLNAKARFPPKVCILAIGGDHVGISDIIEAYDPYTDSWSLFHAMESGLIKFSAVSLDGTVMWFGGERVNKIKIADPSGTLYFDASPNVKEAWSMELASKTVSAMPAMTKGRIGLVSAVVDRMVYVIGGSEEQKILTSISRWNPRDRSWTKMKSMMGERTLFAAVVHNDKIYVIGRYYKGNTMEVYDPKADTWTKLPAMKKHRDDCAAACWGDYIYAIGGVNGVSALCSVERYDVNTQIWDFVAHMPTTVWSGAAVAYHNRIVVVGGYGSSLSLEYNIETNTWKMLSSLVQKRHSHSLVLIPPEFVHNPDDKYWSSPKKILRPKKVKSES
ncbi:kelch-like protein 35 [Arctopsyche grandis]|uniref:kelch-like protein 35 n=1 Tax=Arctopsyche grandis TaxID=121162 RepID=UPI00406D932C